MAAKALLLGVQRGAGRLRQGMLSVIIATLDSERALVQTLAPLVPGATAGLISEVVVADGGSRDETAIVADLAGCNFIVANGNLGGRLKTAARVARVPWLLFLRPGTILDQAWIGEARNFINQPADGARAASFRRAARGQSSLRDALSVLSAALGAKPRPEQGLLISKQFYETLGRHSEQAADPETELLRRIGSRIATLSTPAFVAA